VREPTISKLLYEKNIGFHRARWLKRLASVSRPLFTATQKGRSRKTQKTFDKSAIDHHNKDRL